MIETMTDQTMTAEQAATYLKLPVHTLKAFVEQAGLPAIKLKGGPLVFQRRQVDRWLGRGTNNCSS